LQPAFSFVEQVACFACLPDKACVGRRIDLDKSRKEN
jgi:hypothetical protein